MCVIISLPLSGYEYLEFIKIQRLRNNCIEWRYFKEKDQIGKM